VALFWVSRDRPLAGVFLALGTAVKPVMALMGLYLLMRGHWKAVGWAIGTYLGLLLLALACFGWAPIASYVVANPVTRMPGWAVVGHNSVSLLATALKLSGVVVTAAPLHAPWTNPLFLLLAPIVLGSTLWLLYRLPRAAGGLGSELGLALLIPASLLLYPNTLHHYTVLLVVPLLWLWTHARQLRLPPLLAIAIIAGSYWLVLAEAGDVSVLAIVLIWISLGIVGLGLSKRVGRQQEVAVSNVLQG